MSIVLIRARAKKEARIDRAVNYITTNWREDRQVIKYEHVKPKAIEGLADTILLVNVDKGYSQHQRMALYYLITQSRKRAIAIIFTARLAPKQKIRQYLDKRIIFSLDKEVRCYFKNFLWVRNLRERSFQKIDLRVETPEYTIL